MRAARLMAGAIVLVCAGATSRASAAGFFDDFDKAVERGRETRCKTALCWGDRNEFGLEPLADIPLGKTFSRDQWGSLAKFENSHDITASFVAGVRLWAFHDLASVSVYLSKPLYDGSATIRLSGSAFQYPAGNIRRPYPGAALGLFGDTLWIGVDYDQLRNGDGDTNRDLNYPRGQVVSSTWVFTVAILPVTLARNGLGALRGSSDGGGAAQQQAGAGGAATPDDAKARTGAAKTEKAAATKTGPAKPAKPAKSDAAAASEKPAVEVEDTPIGDPLGGETEGGGTKP